MIVFDYINNSDLYELIKDSTYRNLRTRKEGVVDESKAKSIFTKNRQATELINQYPMISEMIFLLDLRIEK